MALEEKAEEKKRKQEEKEERTRKREIQQQEMAVQKEAEKTKGKQIVLDTTNLLSFAWTVNRHHVITCALLSM